MLLTIFANEKPIYLTNVLTEDLIILSKQNDVLFFNNEKINVNILLTSLEDKKYTAAIILGNNFTATKKDFFAQFININAAGGIVLNENKDILFIYRHQKWDLPKGKVEPNENIETCAQREIAEETGVINLTFKRKVGETYHIYKEENKTVLKTCHWHYYTTISKQTTKAQTEEGITEVSWVKTQNIKTPMANTYENIKVILSTFFNTP